LGDKSRIIVISGYYGFANSGDEAVLHSILSALRGAANSVGLQINPVILSGNPVETKRIHQVDAVNRMRPKELLRAVYHADAFISGGGSLLQDVTSRKSMIYYLTVILIAILFRKKVYIYAQGIGPIRNRRWFAPFIHFLFARSRLVSVRDQQSKQLLITYGLSEQRIDIVPDPVMGMCLTMGSTIKLPHQHQPNHTRKTIAVSVRFWRKDREELKQIASAMATTLRNVNADVYLLPFHLPTDVEASQYVLKQMVEMGISSEQIKLHPGAEHPQDLLSFISSCDILIGMRLHSLIYAATTGVPVVGISYDPKIDEFLQQIGERATGTTDTIQSIALTERIQHLLQHGKVDWWEEKKFAITSMQQQATRMSQQIIQQLRI
jgi:polysaccharide pyruvyl transferase CsaB